MLLVFVPQALEPGWVGPAIAVSVTIIALIYVGMVAGLFLAAREAAKQARELTQALNRMEGEMGPALQALKLMGQQGEDLATSIKMEVGAVLETSRKLRGRVEAGADRIQEKLEDLEALYDVVAQEVEETALDVASGLRTVRGGLSWARRLRRLLPRGRRR